MSPEERALKRKEEIQKEREKRQENRERKQMELQQAFNASGDLSRGWMSEILGTDDLEDKLQENSIDKIQTMLNKQWIVANLTDAETYDRTYWLEVQKYKIFGEHPREGSLVAGPMRSFLYADDAEELRPLTTHERNAIDQVVTGLKNMVTRSRTGFERKQINTNIARTETETGESEDENGLAGFFG